MKKLLPLLVLLLAGCSSQKYTIHPGAVNTFDSQTYDSLLVTNSVIESTKADLAANKFPSSIAGNVKTALNNLVTAYNALDSAYLVYHAAAVAGTATPAQTSAVSAAGAQVSAATSALSSTKGS